MRVYTVRLMSFLVLINILSLCNLVAQDSFFNISMGPDIKVTNTENAYGGSRFRTNIEFGSNKMGFLFQPSFGRDVSAIFLGVRLMLPFQVGSKPLFIAPDISAGIDFGFAYETLGLAFDNKVGVRLFYEVMDAVGISFRPLGLNIRYFNVWFGEQVNQTKISVSYEIQLGLTYFF